MKVTKEQAKANRAHIVKTASSLFRERGYDGVGIADLMAAAGFTQGGFYKHFPSKAGLMAESAACGIAQSVESTVGASATDFVKVYLSREHRDNPGAGCTMAALGGDAGRKEDEVRASFAAGIENQLAVLLEGIESADGEDPAQARATVLSTMAHALGAIVMSRACPDDSALADEILEASRNSILAMLTPSGSPRWQSEEAE